MIGNWSATNLDDIAMMISSLYESGFDSLLAFRLGFVECKGKILDTINISEMVWYVDTSAGPGGGVRSFSSLTNSDIQRIDPANPAEGSNLNVGGKTTINIYADNAILIDNIGPGGDIDFGGVEIVTCKGSKSESFIAEICIFAGSFAPRCWTFCNS